MHVTVNHVPKWMSYHEAIGRLVITRREHFLSFLTTFYIYNGLLFPTHKYKHSHTHTPIDMCFLKLIIFLYFPTYPKSSVCYSDIFHCFVHKNLWFPVQDSTSFIHSYIKLFKGTLMQIWKSLCMFVFI